MKTNVLLFAAALIPNPLVVHEWGTFTALQGSDGLVVRGLHHEEESLPSFVHSRDPLSEALRPRPLPTRRRPPIKGIEFEDQLDANTPLSVTQKMETPVIYLHTPFEQRVKIDVGFPQGIISQYYPNATSFSPAIGSVTSLTGGQVTFDVTAVDGTLPIPAVSPESVYAPSRMAEANYLKSGDENEKLIFYRGLGDFQNSVRVTSAGGALRLKNTGPERVRGAFLVHVDREGGGALQALGGIAAQGDLEVPAQAVESLINGPHGNKSFPSVAAGILAKELQATGLYADESRAMTDTWKRSYFLTPGLRVLYVLPQEETERLLPMRVTPAPKELVRTLVGRVEVLRDTDEQRLIARVTKEGGLFPAEAEFGRFAEAKLRRLRQVAATPEAREQLDALIERVK